MAEFLEDDPRVAMVNGVPLLKEFMPQPPAPVPAPSGADPNAVKYGVPFPTLPGAGVPFAAVERPPAQPQPPVPTLSPEETGAAKLNSAPKTAADFVRPASATQAGPVMGTTTETQTAFHTYGKKQLAALDKANEAQAKAVDAAAAVGEQRAAEEAAYKGRMQAELESQSQVAQAHEAERQRRLQDQETKVQSAVDDFKTKKLDPDKLWKEKGTGAGIAAALATAVGQFAAVMTGTRNVALDQINAMVERNIDAQRQEIANARENVSLENNMLQQLRQRGLDEREAEHALRQTYIDDATRQLDVMAAKYKSPELRANAEQMKAQLQAVSAEQAVKRSEATVQRQSVTAPLKGAAGGGQQLPAGEASKLGEANAAVKNVNELYSRWDKDAKGVTGWLASFLPLTDASRYETNQNAAAQVIGTYLEGGKLAEPDLPRYKKMLPAPGDSEATAQRKREAIANLIANRQKGEKDALAGAGYNVSGIKDAQSTVNFKKAE